MGMLVPLGHLPVTHGSYCLHGSVDMGCNRSRRFCVLYELFYTKYSALGQ